MGINESPRYRNVCGSKETLDKQRAIDKADYNFYAKVLRVIYSKPKIRNKIIQLMKEIEGTIYHRIPRQR